MPYPKEPWYKLSIVITSSEVAPWGVKESHYPALLVYSPHALPRQQAKNIAVIRDKVGLSKLMFLPY